jgi:hypothetical protein
MAFVLFRGEANELPWCSVKSGASATFAKPLPRRALSSGFRACVAGRLLMVRSPSFLPPTTPTFENQSP